MLVSLAGVGRKSLPLDFAFRCGTEFTCVGGIVYVAVSAEGDTIPVPDPLRDALGEPATLRAA